MKKLVLSLALAMVVGGATSAVAVAQGGGGGAGRAGMQARMREALFKGITLTSDQQTKIDSIFARYQREMPRRNPGDGPPSDEEMKKRMAMMQKRNDEIRAVLKDDQKKVFDANLEEMRKMMGGGRQ